MRQQHTFFHACLDNDAHPGEAHGFLTETVQFRVVQLVKHSALNHLILPPDGDCTGAEPLEEQFIFGVKRNVLNLRGVPECVRVFGVDHIGFWHPRGLHKPCLQTVEIDSLKKDMVSRVIPTTVKKRQYMLD